MTSVSTTATATVTNHVVVNIPSSYNIKSDNPDFEKYLTDAIFDYIELKEDEELKKQIAKNKKIKILSKKLDKIAWDL